MDTKTKIEKYKQLKLPPKLHKKIKTAAVQQNKTMVQLLEEKFN